MGYEERQMDAGELRLLRTLADWVEVELATENELHRAALVQRALRPRSVIRLSGLEVAGRCVTARQIGGDFYDWFIARDLLHIVAGDAKGKGIGAALIASSVRAVLRGAARFISIEEAFNRTAHDLDQDLGDTSTFVTAFGACLDPVTGQGQYVDAGHGLAVVIDVVEHGRSPGTIRYSFTLEVHADRLLGRLRDAGPPLPESERPMPDLDSADGRGPAIARVALDALDHQRVDDHNEWTMVRRRR